jgi:hypothetical protein
MTQTDPTDFNRNAQRFGSHAARRPYGVRAVQPFQPGANRMSIVESNTAVIEIGPLKISFPMNDPRIIRSSSADASQAPIPGEYWVGQGGIYAGIMAALDGDRPYHLILSVDQVADVAWGGYGHDEDEATSRHDGLENTRALIESERDHPAAQWASQYTKDGHSDFYLPAQRELSLCYATCAEKFEKAWYWSSTQYSAGYTWIQTFADGYQLAGNKDNPGRARAVRRIEI